MTLTELYIEWENLKGKEPIKITDQFSNDDIAFKLSLSDSDYAELKYLFFNMCYFPAIKSKDSGLHFDYQIKGCSEEIIFRIQFRDIINDESELSAIIKAYFTKVDENGFIIEPGKFEMKKISPKTLKVELDLGGIDCSENIIEDFMSYLDKNFDNIKKVIIE